MSGIGLTSLQISRHDDEVEQRTNGPVTETWLDIRIHVTGTPASISRLHGNMMQAQFGGGTIEQLANALGNSSCGRFVDEGEVALDAYDLS